jgi:hypothetical protein
MGKGRHLGAGRKGLDSVAARTEEIQVTAHRGEEIL